MKVYVMNLNNFDDPNQLEVVFTNTYVEVVGKVSSPNGQIIIDDTTGLLTINGLYIGLDDGNSSYLSNPIKYVAKIIRTDNPDGVHTVITYEIDWLRTYYNFYLMAHSGKCSPLKMYGIEQLASSKATKWNRWQNVALPTKGVINAYDHVGEIVSRMTSQDSDQAFVVVYKQGFDVNNSYATPGVTALIMNWLNLKVILEAISKGDHGNYYGSRLATLIQGIYMLPAVTCVPAGDLVTPCTTNLQGVVIKRDAFVLQANDNNSTSIQIDPITAELTTTPTINYDMVVYDDDSPSITPGVPGISHPAYLHFNHLLSITLNDFRDLYYKQYKMYVPYIGLIDVPVTKLASYPTDADGNYIPETLTLGLDYLYDIYEGKISYRWTTLPGMMIDSWHPVPDLPYSTSQALFQIEQNNAKSSVSNISSVIGSAIGVGAGVATGNVGMAVSGLVTGISSIGQNIAMNDIANNAAAHSGVSSTSLSGFEGYSYSRFYLIIVETEIACSLTDYLASHGYPDYADYGGIGHSFTGNFKVWLSVKDWRPDCYYFKPLLLHTQEMINQLNSMDYVYIYNA